MTVSLAKGQQTSLVKPGGGSLTTVRMGLGWDPAKKKGLFGRLKTQSIDLDASALLFDGGRNLVDAVWFNQLTSKDGAVRHTEDNLTGSSEGDDESIIVDLTRLPRQVTQIVFAVNSFTGQDFSQIENAFCRLIDQTTEVELARYDLSGSGQHNAQIMASDARRSASLVAAPISARTSSLFPSRRRGPPRAGRPGCSGPRGALPARRRRSRSSR